MQYKQEVILMIEAACSYINSRKNSNTDDTTQITSSVPQESAWTEAILLYGAW